MKKKQDCFIYYSGFFLLELLIGLLLSLIILQSSWWILGVSYNYLMKARAIQKGLCILSDRAECRMIGSIAPIEFEAGYLISEQSSVVACGDITISVVIDSMQSEKQKLPTIVIVSARGM
jgi:hypothetical protein